MRGQGRPSSGCSSCGSDSYYNKDIHPSSARLVCDANNASIKYLQIPIFQKEADQALFQYYTLNGNLVDPAPAIQECPQIVNRINEIESLTAALVCDANDNSIQYWQIGIFDNSIDSLVFRYYTLSGGLVEPAPSTQECPTNQIEPSSTRVVCDAADETVKYWQISFYDPQSNAVEFRYYRVPTGVLVNPSPIVQECPDALISNPQIETPIAIQVCDASDNSIKYWQVGLFDKTTNQLVFRYYTLDAVPVSPPPSIVHCLNNGGGGNNNGNNGGGNGTLLLDGWVVILSNNNKRQTINAPRQASRVSLFNSDQIEWVRVIVTFVNQNSGVLGKKMILLLPNATKNINFQSDVIVSLGFEVVYQANTTTNVSNIRLSPFMATRPRIIIDFQAG